MVTSHKVTLSSALLTPATTFHYTVKSTDAVGNAAASPDASFTTKGVSLKVRVINQKNQPVNGAKVVIATKSGTTNSSGHTTISDLPLGQQIAGVTYKGKTTAVPTKIKNPDANGQAEPVVLKIRSSNSLLVLILGAALVVAVIAGIVYLLRKGKHHPPGSGPVRLGLRRRGCGRDAASGHRADHGPLPLRAAGLASELPEPRGAARAG